MAERRRHDTCIGCVFFLYISKQAEASGKCKRHTECDFVAVPCCCQPKRLCLCSALSGRCFTCTSFAGRPISGKTRPRIPGTDRRNRKKAVSANLRLYAGDVAKCTDRTKQQNTATALLLKQKAKKQMRKTMVEIRCGTNFQIEIALCFE